MTARIAAAALALLLALGATVPAGAAGLPVWAERAIERGVPAWASASDAVWLYDEEAVVVPAGGRVVTTSRGAVRVQSRMGKPWASGVASLTAGASAVRSVRGWIVDADGRVEELKRDRVVTRSMFPDFALYSEAQEVRVTPLDAPPGSTFCWEIVIEEDPLLARWGFYFTSAIPELDARFSLTLPPGLEPVVSVVAADSLEASQEGRTWAWRSRDRRAEPREAFAMPRRWDRTRVIATLAGASGERTPGGLLLGSWADVSRWLGELSEPRAAVTPQLVERAGAIAPQRSDTLATLRALATAVARMNYVSHDLGLGRGWGWVPHAATDVMTAGFGDCKDKANLVRALAGALDHRGYLLSVNSRGVTAVDTLSPTPGAFDHCIVALQVPDGTRLPAAFTHPTLGTLVAFDATDPATPFGELPAVLQGAPALLEAPWGEGLVALPSAPRGHDRVRERIEARLDTAGALASTVTLELSGAEACDFRRARNATDLAAVQRWLEARLADGSGSARLSALTWRDDTLANRVTLAATVSVPTHARALSGGLLALRTSLRSGPRVLADVPATRRLPVSLDAVHLLDEFDLRLPEGRVVDELPPDLVRSNGWGELHATWRVEGGVVRMRRELRVDRVLLPVSRLAEYREFARDWLAAERAVVVLRRP